VKGCPAPNCQRNVAALFNDITGVACTIKFGSDVWEDGAIDDVVQIGPISSNDGTQALEPDARGSRRVDGYHCREHHLGCNSEWLFAGIGIVYLHVDALCVDVEFDIRQSSEHAASNGIWFAFIQFL